MAILLEQLSDEAIKAAAVVWYDRHLTPSREWDNEILGRLRRADIILVFANPAYFQSAYCMQTEMPLIRARQGEGRSVVRVIRLRRCELLHSDFEGLTIWPEEGRAVEDLVTPSREMEVLRTWLKVQVCQAIVARNADRYDGESRDERIRRQESGRIDPLQGSSDDLSFLHEQLGEPYTPPNRWAWGMGGGAVGLVTGVAIKSWFFPGVIKSIFGSVLFLASLGFIAGSVKPTFRQIEMAFEDRRRRRKAGASRDYLFLWSPLSFLVDGFVIGGGSGAAAIGAGVGLPLGIVLRMGRWSLDSGVFGTGIAGAILAALAGIDFAQSFRPKRLKVFTDVRHLYQASEVEPLPPCPSRRSGPRSQEYETECVEGAMPSLNKSLQRGK